MLMQGVFTAGDLSSSKCMKDHGLISEIRIMFEIACHGPGACDMPTGGADDCVP
jgi:hypothetical protein